MLFCYFNECETKIDHSLKPRLIQHARTRCDYRLIFHTTMAASAFTAGAWKMRRRQLYPEAAAAAAAAVADDSDDDDTGARDG